MYFLRRRGMSTGPHHVDQLERMRSSGHLMAQDQLSADKQVWVSAGDLFPALFGPVPPPVPTKGAGKSSAPPLLQTNPSRNSTEWFYVDTVTRQRQGPVTVRDLATLAHTRQFKGHNLVWQKGMPEWIRADRVLPEIFPKSSFHWGIVALLIGLLAGIGLAAWLLYLALAGPNSQTVPPEKPQAEGDFGPKEANP